MDEITRLQAEVLRVLAHPARIELLHVLATGPMDVNGLAARIRTSQPNASQHLAALRAVGLVEPDRHGREIRYRLTDPDVIVACGVMRAVLQRRLERLALLASRSASTRLGPLPDIGRPPA
jgi:ArsR family transcriptional regulator